MEPIVAAGQATSGTGADQPGGCHCGPGSCEPLVCEVFSRSVYKNPGLVGHPRPMHTCSKLAVVENNCTDVSSESRGLLKENLAVQLREAILAGQILPGEKII